MEKIRIISPFLFGRLLEHKTIGIESPIVLPYGCLSRTVISSYEFYAIMEKGQMIGLVGRSEENHEEVQMLPAYEEFINIDIEGRQIQLKIWEIVNDQERCKAYEIIMRSHYMSAPNKGLILAIKIVNHDDQEFLFAISKRKGNEEDSWSKAWSLKDFDMIGCIVIDQLTYANPKGRKDIAMESLSDSEASALLLQSRDRIISELKIAWISRVAIDAPYRRFGIGSLLAAKSAYVAKQYRIPSAKYVETYITQTKDAAKILLENPYKCFFVKAGYHIYNELLDSKRQAFPDSIGNRIILKPANKLYLFRKTEESL